MRLDHLLKNMRVYFSTSVSEHAACKTLKIKHPVYLTRAARREPIIITDTRHGAIRLDKSLTVNCLVLFMKYLNEVQMSCIQTLRHGIRLRHVSLFCLNSSSAARALCGIGIAVYVASFLVNIFHLPLSCSFLASLEKASPIHIWPAERLRSRELEDTCTIADGWHEWKLFQIGDVVFGFPTRSIAHHEINLRNA